MSKVAVKPELIRWARERSGLTVDDMVQRFPRYEEWERGESQPTLRQLEDLAKKTLTPLGYFFLPEPPEDKLPIPDFRTVKDQPVKRPSPNLLETVQVMQRRQDWMIDFLTDQGEQPIPFVKSVQPDKDPIQIAGLIREALGISPQWARQHRSWTEALLELRRVVESAGVMVVINGVVGNNTHRKLDPDEFRGFVLCDKLAPLVFINGSDAKAAQMFTLAHELAHLWLGREGVFNLEALQPANDEIEKFCNHIAAEFLVPEPELKAMWRQAANTDEPFQTLARQFKVSPLVAARRALDLGMITRDEFFTFYNEYQEDERRQAAARPSGGDFYATQEVRLGRRFGEAVIRAAKDGRILYRDAYQLTGLFGQTFDRFAKGLGFWRLMNNNAKYVLDANAFIQSKRRFYALDICPGYWNALIWHHGKNQICSIDRVRSELERGGDDLWEWTRTQLAEQCFASTDSADVIGWYGKMVAWVQAHPQFLPQAKAEFAETERADAWLIAYAKSTGCVLVTLEEYDPNIKKRVPIPNVCREFGVEYVTTFQMLRALQARFNWQPPA